MIYTIEQISIKVVPAGKENAGTKYVQGTLLNKMNLWENARQFVSFNQVMVEKLSKYLPTTQGGVATEAQPIPEELRTIAGEYVEWEYPGGLFYKTYPYARTLRNGKTVNAGDKVCSPTTGQPLLFSKLTVFCMYGTDEFGQKKWLQGNNPNDVGQTMFRSFCEPLQAQANQQSEQEQAEINF